jgi:hypothetical protein
MSAPVSLASTGASLSWSAVRGTARQAMVVAGAAAAAAVCTRGEVVACVRGVRTCWKGKECAHEERGVGVGVFCEQWRLPLLSTVRGTARQVVVAAGAAAAAAVCTRGEVVACVRGVRTRTSGALMRGGGSAPGSVARTGASLSWSAVRGTARQAAVVCWCSRCGYSRVAKWSPACGEFALASGASGCDGANARSVGVAPGRGGAQALDPRTGDVGGASGRADEGVNARSVGVAPGRGGAQALDSRTGRARRFGCTVSKITVQLVVRLRSSGG